MLNFANRAVLSFGCSKIVSIERTVCSGKTSASSEEGGTAIALRRPRPTG
jgi:hypothetical protein